MSRPSTWSKEEHKQLRALYPTVHTPQLAQILGRSVKAVASRAKVLGIQKAVAHGGHRPWTAAHEKLLRSLYPDHSTAAIAKRVGHSLSATYRWAHKLGLYKTQAYLDGNCRLQPGSTIGAAVRFRKGHVPANKGTRRPGWAPGRMAETQFKKGGRSANYLPIGTVKVDADGYLRRKIADGAGGFGNYRVWEFVHRRAWEDAHGPIPKGHRIWWKDRNHSNCSLDNLEMLTDAEHMARTTIHNLPPELKEVIQLAGVLKRKIREATNEKHDC